MLRFQFSPCHTFKKKWKTHICWEFSAWHEFISQKVKIIFFEQIKLVNTYKTIVYYTMEYPALKTFATLPSTFTRNIPPLDSLTPSTLTLDTPSPSRSPHSQYPHSRFPHSQYLSPLSIPSLPVPSLSIPFSPLDSLTPSTLTLDTPPLVDQPNRNLFYNIETNYWKSLFFFIKFLLPKINSDVHPLLFIEIWNQKIFFFKILIFLIINSLTVVFISYSPVAYSLLFSLCCAWYKMFRTK